MSTLSAPIFSPPKKKCFFYDCSTYLGLTDVENTLEAMFTDGAVENSTFR
jgi:hypothetical protein